MLLLATYIIDSVSNTVISEAIFHQINEPIRCNSPFRGRYGSGRMTLYVWTIRHGFFF